MLWPVWLDHKTNWWWWKLRVSLESGFGKLLKNLWVLWLEHNKETLGCEIWTLTNNSRLICSCNHTESSTITEEIQTSLNLFGHCTRSCCNYKLIIPLKLPNTPSQLYFAFMTMGFMFGINSVGAYKPEWTRGSNSKRSEKKWRSGRLRKLACWITSTEQLPIESVRSDRTDYLLNQFGWMISISSHMAVRMIWDISPEFFLINLKSP